MQCHTIKVVQKLDIYNRFKNGIEIACRPSVCRSRWWIRIT